MHMHIDQNPFQSEKKQNSKTVVVALILALTFLPVVEPVLAGPPAPPSVSQRAGAQGQKVVPVHVTDAKKAFEPKLVSFVPSMDDVRDVEIIRKDDRLYAFCASPHFGLTIVDVAVDNPDNYYNANEEKIVSTLGISEIPITAKAVGVSEDGNLAIIGGDINGIPSTPNIAFIDTTNVAEPHVIKKITAQGAANTQDIEIHDGTVFLASGPSGLVMMDTATQQPLGVVPAANAKDVAIKNVQRNTYAFLAAAQEGLKIINVDDPQNPLALNVDANLGANETADKVAVYAAPDGKVYAYVGSLSGKVHIVDVSNLPASAEKVGEYVFSPTPVITISLAVHASGRLAIGSRLKLTNGIGFGYVILRLLDLSANPASPNEIGSTWNTAFAYDIDQVFAIDFNDDDPKHLFVADLIGLVPFILWENPVFGLQKYGSFKDSMFSTQNGPNAKLALHQGQHLALVTQDYYYDEVRVVNFADKNFPDHFSTLKNTSEFCFSTAIIGDMSYLGCEYNSYFMFFDMLATPITQVGPKYPLGGLHQSILDSMERSNGQRLLFVNASQSLPNGYSLVIVDVTNPLNPQVKSVTPIKIGAYPYFVGALKVFETPEGKIYAYAIAGLGNKKLVIIDATNPASVQIINDSTLLHPWAGLLSLSKSSKKFAVWDPNGIRIYSFENDPENPSLLGTFDTQGLAQTFEIRSMELIQDGKRIVLGGKTSGEYGLTASYGGMRFLNVTDPSDIKMESLLNTPGAITSMQEEGNYLFAADGAAVLDIVKLSE